MRELTTQELVDLVGNVATKTNLDVQQTGKLIAQVVERNRIYADVTRRMVEQMAQVIQVKGKMNEHPSCN